MLIFFENKIIIFVYVVLILINVCINWVYGIIWMLFYVFDIFIR